MGGENHAPGSLSCFFYYSFYFASTKPAFLLLPEYNEHLESVHLHSLGKMVHRMAVRQLHGDAVQAFGYTQWGFRGEFWAVGTHLRRNG